MTSVIHSCEKVICNAKKLIEFTRDDNNIIIIYNINTLNFTNFYSCYISLMHLSAPACKIDDNFIVMLVRSNGVVLCPKPELGNSESLKNALKTYLKPIKNLLIKNLLKTY